MALKRSFYFCLYYNNKMQNYNNKTEDNKSLGMLYSHLHND